MGTPVVNFGLVTVSGGYSAAATSVNLETGHGSRLPDQFPFPVSWWNATDYAHAADDPFHEIVLVNNRSTDNLSPLTRGQEGTSATAKDLPGKTYRMSLGITKAMWEGLQRPKEFVQGLQLQTHRDSDLAHKQVELVDVDAIIMDDGTELRNDNGEWSGKSADITVLGAGGLDVGVEANEWYEIYAIAKEDGTQNLLLHKSHLWATDTNYISGEDATQGVRSAVDNSTVKVAQGFKFNGGQVPFIEVKLLKVGTPTGKIWFTIETDNAGKPSGTAVAISHAYDVARLSTTAQWVRIPTKSSQSLSASPTQYHLVAQGTWTVSPTNYVGWRMDGSAGSSANGSKALFDSDTGIWTTDTDDDLHFAIVAEQGGSSIVMPSGYTKKCFLGWVYNDNALNFRTFKQAGRTVRYMNLSTTANRAHSFNGSAEIVDLLGYIPPLKLSHVHLALSGTGSAGALVAIGDLSATDVSSVGTSTGAQAIMSTAITSDMPSSFTSVIAQHTGIMAMGTNGAYLWVVGFDF